MCTAVFRLDFTVDSETQSGVVYFGGNIATIKGTRQRPKAVANAPSRLNAHEVLVDLQQARMSQNRRRLCSHRIKPISPTLCPTVAHSVVSCVCLPQNEVIVLSLQDPLFIWDK
jgi:hypothetical protein